MRKIPTFLVKKLRIKTGAGVIDCKKALIETEGNIEKSIDLLRKLGRIKAEQKQSFLTSNGSIFINTNGKCTAMLELNCETDFVVREHSFLSFGKEIVDYAITLGIDNSRSLQELFEEKRINLVAKLNENVVIRRIVVLNENTIGSYLHHNRIGVLVQMTSCSEHQMFINNIAMHIAASKPEYLRSDLIPASVIEREYAIQLELAMRSNKPESIVQKIVQGRMIKFFGEKSLLSQMFILDPSQTVGEIIARNNVDILSFIRFEVGELISN
ncbi:MAG: translation elongation factor Ts [Buchnera aphidicola (Meitanaphis elongallis)]